MLKIIKTKINNFLKDKNTTNNSNKNSNKKNMCTCCDHPHTH
ncbi:MAG: hypothetical protein QM532_04480 [Cyanobium sp. MAG06]|nr:hypothetical protein [Cyanobium sp. MAG06]